MPFDPRVFSGRGAPQRAQPESEFFERGSAHQFVGGEAERIEIAAGFDFTEVFGDNFGGDVSGGALEQCAVDIADSTSEAEVAEFNASAGVDHDVRRLDVSVHDASVVEIMQSSKRMGECCFQAAQVHLPPSQSFGQRPLHQFHHQPALLAVDVIDGDDVGVLQ